MNDHKCCLTVSMSIEKRHGVWAGASVAGVQWLFMQHVSDNIFACAFEITHTKRECFPKKQKTFHTIYYLMIFYTLIEDTWLVCSAYSDNYTCMCRFLYGCSWYTWISLYSLSKEIQSITNIVLICWLKKSMFFWLHKFSLRNVHFYQKES